MSAPLVSAAGPGGSNCGREQVEDCPETLERPPEPMCATTTARERGRCHFRLPAALLQKLSELQSAKGVMPPSVVPLTLFRILLSRFNVAGEVIAMAVSGGAVAEGCRSGGQLASVVPLSFLPAEDMCFADLMRSTDEAVRKAHSHREVSSSPELAGLSAEPLAVVASDSRLALHVMESPEGMRGWLEYDADLFDAGELQRGAERLQRLAAQAAATPELPVFALDLTLPLASADSSRLTMTQQMLWADQRVHASRESAFNLRDALRIRARVDPRIFEHALQHVVDRTAALRLSFSEEPNGSLRQRILPSRRVPLVYVDLSTAADPQRAADEWLGKVYELRIDPTQDAPFAYTLLKLSEDEFLWCRRHHHLIVDAVGLSVLTRRLARAYSALSRNERPSLRDDATDYLEYLHRDAEYLYSPAFPQDRKYWQESSGDAAAPTLSSRTTGANPDARSIEVAHELQRAASARLGQLAAACKVGFPKLIAAAAALYVGRMTGRSEVSLGIQTHGRVDDVMWALVATCATRLPVHFRVREEHSVAEFLTAAARDIESSLAHGRFHPERIRRLRRMTLHDPPLYRICVNVYPDELGLPFGGGVAESYPFRRHDVQERDLELFVLRSAANIRIYLRANPVLYERWEVETHLQRYVELLDALCTLGASGRLDQLQLPSQREACAVLGDFSRGRDVRRSSASLAELIQEQAARMPSALALSSHTEDLTFAELQRRSDDVADFLRRHGMGAGKVVALCIARSAGMVVGMLGVLKSGAAYLPVDAGVPAERLALMMRDSGANVLLTSRALRDRLGGSGTITLALDEPLEASDRCGGGNDQHDGRPGPEDLAYVIYTSGSTGAPKGACVHHRGLRNLLDWYLEEFAFGPSDRILIASSITFDLTQKNILAPLMCGARIFLAAEPFDPGDIIRWIERERITTLNLTPSAFYAIVEEACESNRTGALGSLRRVFLGGEPIKTSRIWPLTHALRELQVVNTYGPTECSDVVAFHSLRPEELTPEDTPVPIGRPISNTQLYILDERRRPVPVGVPGELYVGGAGVGGGYVKREELTAERFLTDPFCPEGHGRVYRTGDVTRWRPEGTIEFLGRNDDQVKIRGYRIEPAEIEAQLSRHARVLEAAVVPVDAASGDKVLVAYVTTDSPALDTRSLSAHLERALPAYMIPSRFIVLPSMPHNSHGKLDRAALRSLAPPLREDGVDDAPRGEIEQMLAGLWQEALHVARVGRDDSFFELGGHSIVALRVTARIGGILGTFVPVRQLFDHPTPAGFAASLLSQALLDCDGEAGAEADVGISTQTEAP